MTLGGPCDKVAYCVWFICALLRFCAVVCICLLACVCSLYVRFCTYVCVTLPAWLPFPPGHIPGHNSMWMAAESGRVVTEEQEEQEELPASGAKHHAHTRSQSHIQFQPMTHTAQWQAHTRSHSHTFFNTPSHTQPQKYGCRLTHSLSAMTKGEKGAQGPAGKLIKPTEPLFPKSRQKVSCPVLVLLSYWSTGPYHSHVTFESHLLCMWVKDGSLWLIICFDFSWCVILQRACSVPHWFNLRKVAPIDGMTCHWLLSFVWSRCYQ